MPDTPAPNPAAGPKRLSMPIHILLMLVAVPLLLSTLAGIAVGAFPSTFGFEGPLWIFAGFEAVMLVASVFATLVALGRFPAGRALTLGCVAASVAIASTLESLSLNHAIGEFQLRPVLLARLAAAAAIAACVPVLVLTTPRQWGRFAAGAIVLSPIALLTAPVALARIGVAVPNLLGSLTAALDSAGPAIALFATMLGGLLAILAISIGGHLVITAFDPQTARPPARKPGPPETE